MMFVFSINKGFSPNKLKHHIINTSHTPIIGGFSNYLPNTYRQLSIVFANMTRMVKPRVQ